MSLSLTVSPAVAPSRLGALPLLLRRHFSPFKTYVRRDLRLVVMLNPKCGSTTFRELVATGMQLRQEPPRLSRLWPLNLQRRYLTAPAADYLDVLLRPERYQFYCFVRNPFARLLSAWKSKLAFARHEAEFPRGARRVVRALRQFAAGHNLEGAATGTRIPFVTFVQFVRSQPEGSRNHHWDSQRSVLFTDLISYHRVYRMETEFDSGMTEILSRLGLPRDWTREQLAQPHNASPALREPIYDAELAAQVQALYAADFAEFGYDSQSWRGL